MQETLDLGLKLVWDGGAYTVPGGEIKRFSLDLRTTGFDCTVEFWVEPRAVTDPLFAQFQKPDLLEAAFTVGAHFPATGSGDPPEPLLVRGIVREKRLYEQTFAGLDKKPVLMRRYTVTFSDAAAVLWKQHFPTELYVEKTMKDVIEAQKGAKITLEYDFAPVDAAKPVIFLGLGDPRNLASFFDLLLWYIRANDGVFTYDAVTNKYKIAATKGEVGDAASLDARDVERHEVFIPETPRHNVVVLNASATSASKNDVTNADAVAGVRHDILIRAGVASEVDARKTLETAKLVSHEPEVEVVFGQHPRMTVRPGAIVGMLNATWSDKLFVHAKKYRVLSVVLSGTSLAKDGEGSDRNLGFGKLDADMRVRLETATDPVKRLPAFTAPRYPVYVEGNVVSEAGETADETYQVYKDANQLDVYKVEIPLFAGAKIIAPFNPSMLPGHFHFPAVKKARVLVAFELFAAWIKRTLDWRAAAALPPADSQGNHIVFGLTETNRTLMKHFYTDNKPVLHLGRTMDKDTEIIELMEGTMILQTKENE